MGGRGGSGEWRGGRAAAARGGEGMPPWSTMSRAESMPTPTYASVCVRAFVRAYVRACARVRARHIHVLDEPHPLGRLPGINKLMCVK